MTSQYLPPEDLQVAALKKEIVSQRLTIGIILVGFIISIYVAGESAGKEAKKGAMQGIDEVFDVVVAPMMAGAYEVGYQDAAAGRQAKGDAAY